MTGTKFSARGSSRAVSRQNIGSNRAGRERDPSKRGSPGKPKYEKKRSAEDLLAEKTSSMKSGGRGGKASNGKPRASGGSGGGQRDTSCMKQVRRNFSCLTEEVTYELDLEASNACKLLGFIHADISKIKRRFDDIDFENNGEIDYDEFLEDVGEPRSPFVDAVFSLVDINGNGLLDFSDGTIDEDEFQLLAKTVNKAAPMFPGNFAQALEEFDTNGDGLIDIDEFRILDRRYPMVLFPAFRLQDRLQAGSLSKKRWQEILRRRELRRVYNDYRKQHGGQMPPLKFKEKLLSKLLPCVYSHPHSWYLESLDGDDLGPPMSATPPPAETKKKNKKKKRG